MQADALYTPLFKAPFIDLIVTAPPFELPTEDESESNYARYLEFSENWLRNCLAWSKPQARLCLNTPLDRSKGGARPLAADLTALAQKVGWRYKTTIVWQIANAAYRTTWGSWKSAAAPIVAAPIELILVFYKEEWKKTEGSKISDISAEEFKDWAQGVWRFDAESKKQVGHPAPFPQELAYRCIRLFSYLHDVVFDPFAGSGTTLLVAQKIDRIAMGLELDAGYFELAKDRIIKETGGF